MTNITEQELSPDLVKALSTIHGSGKFTVAEVINLAGLVASGKKVELAAEELEIKGRLYSLQKDYDNVCKELSAFKKLADQKLEPFLQSVSSSITDYLSATAAIEAYDVQWFKNLTLSEVAKIRVALNLIELVKPYTKQTVPLWGKYTRSGTWHNLQN